MKTLNELLADAAARHHHLCPRQVLGVRMGMWVGEVLGLALPQTDKRLLTIVETDGCFSDGIAVATNCWVGRRTMRVEDYGKVAATFVDTQSGHAVRITPLLTARQHAARYAPGAANRWETMLSGYQHMPVAELLHTQPVTLTQPLAAILGRAGQRVACTTCGEEILNGREISRDGHILCHACAGDSYYVDDHDSTIADLPSSIQFA